MTWWDKIEGYVYGGAAALLGAIASGVWWLIRRVFTNQQQIELLTKEIAHRDQLRAEDREDMREVKAGVTRIEDVLLGGTRKP